MRKPLANPHLGSLNENKHKNEHKTDPTLLLKQEIHTRLDRFLADTEAACERRKKFTHSWSTTTYAIFFDVVHKWFDGVRAEPDIERAKKTLKRSFPTKLRNCLILCPSMKKPSDHKHHLSMRSFKRYLRKHLLNVQARGVKQCKDKFVGFFIDLFLRYRLFKQTLRKTERRAQATPSFKRSDDGTEEEVSSKAPEELVARAQRELCLSRPYMDKAKRVVNALFEDVDALCEAAHNVQD